MRIVELRELHRRNSAIHYIKELTAIAVLEWGERHGEADVAITLEHKPVGPPDVTIRLLDTVDWPLLPVIKAIREEVSHLESQGRLP